MFDTSVIEMIKIKKPIIFITGNHEYYLKDSNTKIKEINNYVNIFSVKNLISENRFSVKKRIVPFVKRAPRSKKDLTCSKQSPNMLKKRLFSKK